MDELLFHPKLVHVPMALAVLMPLIALAVVVAWWRNWLPPRGWLLVIGLQAILFGSGLLSLRSGEAEEEKVEKVVAERFIEEHEEAAKLFVWASGGVLALMVVGAALGRRRPALPLAALATAGSLLVLVLGYRTGNAGGQLVYQHGAGRAYQGAATVAADLEAHQADETDDD